MISKAHAAAAQTHFEWGKSAKSIEELKPIYEGGNRYVRVYV
jgi:hypothetical protein